MKDPDFQLQKAYYTALNGNITYSGKDIPIYDRIPRGAGEAWIQIGDFISTRQESKDGYSTERMVSLTCHTRLRSGGGKKKVNSISNQVLQLIIDQPLIDTSGQFEFHEQTLETSSNTEDSQADRVIFQKVLIIKNYVEQI